MAYLTFFSLVSAILYLHGRREYGDGAKMVFSFLALFFMAFLPAFQYEVSTDYKNYLQIIQINPEMYLRNGEFFFYGIVWVIKRFDLSPQFFFVISSFVQSILLLSILIKLERYRYRSFLIFLIIFVSTGMLHNQMNLIRMYVAVYCFINLAICFYERRWVESSIFGLLGVFSHATFIIAIVLIFVPVRVFVRLGKLAPLVFMFSTLFFVVIFNSSFIEMLIEFFIPRYSLYLSTALFSEGTDLISILYKVYFWPIYFIFFLLLLLRRLGLSNFDYYLLGIWGVFSPLFLTFFDSALMVRVYHYFIFFNAIPIYWVFWYFRGSPLYLVALVYLASPYVINVLALNFGAYYYQSIFGAICDFPWGRSQC